MSAADILSKYEESVSSLGLALQKFLLGVLPGVIEQPDEQANIIAYGYGPGYKDTICVIIPSKKCIKLGVYKGRLLDDPAGLLTGEGKVHGYVEISSTTIIQSAGLKKLLKNAMSAYGDRQKPGQKEKR